MLCVVAAVQQLVIKHIEVIIIIVIVLNNVVMAVHYRYPKTFFYESQGYP